jgi:hypothetical protein
VRANDLQELADLRAAGADLSVLDGLGRTPLTLALQLQRVAFANYLLSVGVNFTLQPRNPYQLADVDYDADDRLAQAFMLRLLRTQLLNLAPHNAAKTPHLSLDIFDANQAYKISDAVWTFSCDPCTEAGSRPMPFR